MGLMESSPQARPEGDLEFVPGSLADESPLWSARTLAAVLASGALYYLATRIAWLLCFPDSKVCLFFPPHAVLVSVLLLVPTRHWGAYVSAAVAGHFVATQQAGWPPLYALQCELFDVVKAGLVAIGMRLFIRTPFDRLTLRDALVFLLIAVAIVPFATAFWGAWFTVANNFGTHYWDEWRNLGISNGVTAVVLVPAILLGVQTLTRQAPRPEPARVLEAVVLAVALAGVGHLAFGRWPAGPDTSPALLYAPVPLLLWAAVRFGPGGMSASMLFVTMQAIIGTMQGHGPFLTQTPEENALELQLFLLVVATPLLLLAVTIDEEKRTQAALRDSEARMGLAAESAQLVLWEWDMVNDRLWLQREGRRFFGFGPGERIDHSSLAGRVHPDDRAARAAKIQYALAHGGAYEAEFRIVMPDGTVRWIAARGRGHGPAEAGATPPRILGVSMDITRQKLAASEAQLQRDELAHLARVSTLNALSGSLAHELCQPLSSILSNARAGQRFMAKDPPDLAEVGDILADIVSEDRRAGDIIGRMRSLLQRRQVAPQPVHVNECIEELLRLLHSDLVVRGVTVVNHATGELPPAFADRVQLQQVFLNLIVNACDAMAGNAADDRELTLRTAVVDGELRICVQDRGVGLPEDVETVFQPFHTTKDQGLGMGLSICRSLVTAHRGRLWAEHRPGRGAAFHVALPLAPDA